MIVECILYVRYCTRIISKCMLCLLCALEVFVRIGIIIPYPIDLGNWLHTLCVWAECGCECMRELCVCVSGITIKLQLRYVLKWNKSVETECDA